MPIPISLPIGNTTLELLPYQDSWVNTISYMVSKAHAGKNILFPFMGLSFLSHPHFVVGAHLMSLIIGQKQS